MPRASDEQLRQNIERAKAQLSRTQDRLKSLLQQNLELQSQIQQAHSDVVALQSTIAAFRVALGEEAPQQQ